MAVSPRISRVDCRCGKVGFEAIGEPIMTVTCHCDSCRQAAEQLEAMPGAARVANEEGGTDYVMMRKDRLRCTKGEDLLSAHRLKPDAPTRRVLASCCNSPMFLEFKGGHWLSVYRDRFDVQPSIELRTMAGDRSFSDAIPAYRTHSIRFMWRLFKAWVAMGFRAPAVAPVERM
jgi:hypothetical protein